jgi:large subunit ribosomal protein L5
MPRLKEQYRDQVVPAMIEEFGYDNVMQVPRLTKIVVNVGLGEALQNAKSIASFKLREGRQIGAKVTLRGDRMWHFLDRLCNVALPRRRDFRGVSPNSFDGRGNYTLGFREQLVFPEVDYDTIDRVRGLEVSIVTTAETDEEGRRLLALLGMPFARSEL